MLKEKEGKYKVIYQFAGDVQLYVKRKNGEVDQYNENRTEHARIKDLDANVWENKEKKVINGLEAGDQIIMVTDGGVSIRNGQIKSLIETSKDIYEGFSKALKEGMIKEGLEDDTTLAVITVGS